MLIPAILIGIVSILFGILLTWYGRRLAPRIGLVDKPDGRRKIHERPIAVVGGVAVYFSSTLAILLAYLISPEISSVINNKLQPTLLLLASAGLIAIIGMVDDLVNLRARYKLLGQFAAIAILIVPGDYLIEKVSFFGFSLELHLFAYLFTAFWFLIAINALNLLDGMDGMLGTIGIVVLLSLAFVAFTLEKNLAGIVAISVAGSLIGFLRFNFPPASVYLGDCGSMLLGLTVAAISIHSCIKGPAVAIISPTVLLMLPLMDTTAAIVRRKLTGRGIAIGDRGHLHHVLQKRGLGTSRILVLVSALCIVASLGALVSIYMQSDYAAIVSALMVALILVASGLFGGAELKLIRERIRNVYQRASGNAIEMRVRLQGSADWSAVWNNITLMAEELDLNAVCLDVNAPAWHEGYHHRWSRIGGSKNPLTNWTVEVPLMGGGQIIGRLTISGNRTEGSLNNQLATISRIVEQSEKLAVQVVESSHSITVPHSAQSEPLTASV